MTSADVLDVRGLVCPLPVLRARKVLLSLQAGDELSVLSSDARSPDEFALFCRESGHQIVTVASLDDGVFEITIRAFSARAPE